MGLTIISKRDGSSSEAEVREFKHKVKTLKHLATEIFEDVEDMEAEFGSRYSEREHHDRSDEMYRAGYRRGVEEAEMRRRHGDY